MTNRIAHKPGEFSLGLVHDFVVSFGKRGGSSDLLQRMTEDTAAMIRLVEYLTLGCPKVDHNGVVNACLPKDGDLARLILGDDFISPGEIEKAFGFSYNYDQLMYLVSTLPTMETLLWLRANQYILVAGPVTDTNLFGIRAFDRLLFCGKKNDDIWWEKVQERFTRNEFVRGGQWLMLKKGEVPNSRLMDWNGQSKLVQSPEFIPNVAEVSYGAILYRRLRGVNILPNFFVRTSSVDVNGVHVDVGNQDDGGLSVSNSFSNFGDERLGVSSARK